MGEHEPEQNPLARLLVDFEKDKAIIALTKAGLEADEPAMVAALPAAKKRKVLSPEAI